MNYSSHNNLESLLGGPGRIAVLRVLVDAAGPLTGRQVAVEAGLSPAGAMRVLDRLCERGLVVRVRVGRALLHELDRTNELVSRLLLPLFEGERLLAAEAAATHTAHPRAADVNPMIRPHLEAIEQACRRHRVGRAALFGSATQPSHLIVPSDVDVLVTFEPLDPTTKAREYAALAVELERLLAMPVDVMVSTAPRNAIMQAELDRTQVVLYEDA
ncbi:MAG: MarR family transcriptional regulator [Actinobacteria bacterium]|nr:MAG: MarR family transcriptional regulator [Actinomycetota bacterium]